MLPKIGRLQQNGKEEAFRTNAAFSKPEIYEALEECGEKFDEPARRRSPGTRCCGTATASAGKAQCQAIGGIEKLSLPSGQLEYGQKSDGQDGTP